MEMEELMMNAEEEEDDLDLNAHPSPVDGHLALHLALGISEQEDLDPSSSSSSSSSSSFFPAQASRQNFPRFDPGMSALITQRDEIPEFIRGFNRDPSDITPNPNLRDGSLDNSFRALSRSVDLIRFSHPYDDSTRASYDDFGHSRVLSALHSASEISGLVDSGAEREEEIMHRSDFLNNDARKFTDSAQLRALLESEICRDDTSLHRISGHRASNDYILGRSSGSSLMNERPFFGSSQMNDQPRSSLMNGRRSWGSSRRLSESSVLNERQSSESSLVNERRPLRSSLMNVRRSSGSLLINERRSLESSLMNERHPSESSLINERRLSGSSLMNEQRSLESSSLMNDYPLGECTNPRALHLRSTPTTKRAIQSTDMPTESMSRSADDDDDDVALLSERSRRLNCSPSHWRTARTRVSSVLTRAQSQPSPLNSGPRTQLGIQRISRMSTNEDSIASQLAVQPSDGCIGALANISNKNNEEDVKDNVSGNVGVEFECNICLEMAFEPVVTCCGHLFCWPCLHQWLHVHSITKKCPVCKGLLSDQAIIPIYGRGSSPAGESLFQNPNIPPRPSARRVSKKRFHWEDAIHSELPGSTNATILESIDESLDESNNTNIILERLRVAQTLQQEYFERRSTRLAQRLMARRTPRFDSSSIPRTRELHQRARETLETAADNLTAIQNSIDGLRANMQRLVEFVRSVPRHNSNTPMRNTSSNNILQNVLDEERIFPPQADVREVPLRVIIPTICPFVNVDGQRSSQLQENNGNSASSSYDGENGLHKRCRLN